MSVPNQQRNSTTVAANTVTLANVVALVVNTFRQANTTAISGELNGESMTGAVVASIAEGCLRQALLKQIK